MSISSMTGFARLGGVKNGFRWFWELRSLNSRSLDLRLRLPRGLERLEPILKTLASDRITRGNVSATLSLVRPPRKRTLSINHNYLEQIVALSKKFSNGLDILPPKLDGLLGINGVLEVQEEEETMLVIKTTATQLDALEARVVELHSYDVPELLCIPVVAGHQPYITWVNSEVEG